MNYKFENRISIIYASDEGSDIDREVQRVKSAWQALRGEKDWTKGKDRIDNARTKKLYEMLEKMMYEIDRVQKNYMNSKANHYLHRSATNVLRNSSKPTLQEKAEIMRSVIFPDRKAKAKSAPRLKNVDSEVTGKDAAWIRFEAAENILTDKRPHKNFLSSKKRSVHTEAHQRDFANDIGSVYATASNINEKRPDTAVTDIMKPKFTDTSNKTKARIKSSIEEYLQRYCGNIHESRNSIREKEEKYPSSRFQDVKASASDIADILASHSIEPHVLYENFGKHSDGYDSEDYDQDRSCSNIANTTVTQVISVDTIRANKIYDNMTFENTALCNDARPTEVIDTRSFDNLKQSSVTNCQDNTFIKMGLNKNSLSRDMLSQIMQSEYLRKDLSL